MNKLGVSDVEEWLKLTDKDGVFMFNIKERDLIILTIYFTEWSGQL